VTRWALGLIALFLLLGLSPVGSRKAVHVAVCVTVLALAAVIARSGSGM